MPIKTSDEAQVVSLDLVIASLRRGILPPQELRQDVADTLMHVRNRVKRGNLKPYDPNFYREKVRKDKDLRSVFASEMRGPR